MASRWTMAIRLPGNPLRRWNRDARPNAAVQPAGQRGFDGMLRDSPSIAQLR